MSTYLRHLPLPENRRHELVLRALRRLAADPGNTPDQAAARGMTILRTLIQDHVLPPQAIAGPPLRRSHMKPEEMDRRPWVRGVMRVWRPAWVGLANTLNSVYLDIVLYALLLGGLYALYRFLRY